MNVVSSDCGEYHDMTTLWTVATEGEEIYLVTVQGHLGCKKQKMDCEIHCFQDIWGQQCYDPAISDEGECRWRNACVK